MNYAKIYDDMCKYCQVTTPRDRMISRNPNDERLMDDQIYTEVHHIVPRHCGGSNRDGNLVVLLPEEHFFVHMVRYKAFKQRGDFLAVRFIINGFIGKNGRVGDEAIKRITSKRIGLFRAAIAKFRKDVGWHTDNGRKRISESRRGKIPCICAKTGESVGCVEKNHPKYISGEYIHHTTNQLTAIVIESGEKIRLSKSEYQKNKGTYKWVKSNSGNQNGNFKEMTPERRERLFNLVPRSIEENHLIVGVLEQLMRAEFTEFKRLSRVWIVNNFGSTENFLTVYNTERGTQYIYNKHYRPTSSRKRAKESIKGMKKVNKDGFYKIVPSKDLETYIKAGWKKGRGKEGNIYVKD
jgi:hypothetical protein